MAEGADDVRYDMAMTRQRMADTVAQIESRVSGTVDAVKTKVNVVQWAREHPWPAIAVALAAGYALAATGADRSVAETVADGAIGAATSVKEAASGVVERVQDRFSSGDEAPSPASAEPSWLDRVGARIADEIADLLREPSAQLGRTLARAGGASGRPSYSAIDPQPLGSAGDARL